MSCLHFGEGGEEECLRAQVFVVVGEGTQLGEVLASAADIARAVGFVGGIIQLGGAVGKPLEGVSELGRMEELRTGRVGEEA